MYNECDSMSYLHALIKPIVFVFLKKNDSLSRWLKQNSSKLMIRGIKTTKNNNYLVELLKSYNQTHTLNPRPENNVHFFVLH